MIFLDNIDELILNSTFYDEEGNIIGNPLSQPSTPQDFSQEEESSVPAEKQVTLEETKDASEEKLIITSDYIFTRIVETFISIFGEERISINRKDYAITVHFPKLIVKNSLGVEHPITDMYTTFYFYIDSFTIYLDHFEGIRTSFTMKEYLSGYSFSHLSNSIESTGNFCLGWDTPFSRAINNLKVDKLQGTTFTIEKVDEYTNNLEIVLYMLPEYLSWESLSGGPYKLLSSLGRNRFGPSISYSISTEHKIIADIILSKIIATPELLDQLFDKCILNSGDGLKINAFQLTNLVDSMLVEENRGSLEGFSPYDPVSYDFIENTTTVPKGYLHPESGIMLRGTTIIFKENSIRQTVTEGLPKLDKENLIVSPSIIAAIIEELIKLFSNIKSNIYNGHYK